MDIKVLPGMFALPGICFYFGGSTILTQCPLSTRKYQNVENIHNVHRERGNDKLSNNSQSLLNIVEMFLKVNVI